MLRRMLCLFALVTFTGQVRAQTQTVTTGSASFAIGGNSWTGINVPDGLWSDYFQLYASMKQENSITPGWVDVWNYTGELPINNGMTMSWKADLPKPGGWIHCEYEGVFKITTYFGYFQAYTVNYKVTATYHSYPGG
jgi:hypothetical protein